MPDRSPTKIIIGVTGHRTLQNPNPIIAGVDKTLQAIKKIFENESIVILSPLAEGADRIIAERALAIDGTKLIAVLPMPVEVYLEDFQSPISIKEFQGLLELADEIIELPRIINREESYRNVGKYLVAHCDVMIAIWDGQPARGPGGTAEVVALARDRNLPVAWIYSGQCVNEKVATADAKHGEVNFERFPDQSPE
jgi:hypothetical protein